MRLGRGMHLTSGWRAVKRLNVSGELGFGNLSLEVNLTSVIILNSRCLEAKFRNGLWLHSISILYQF